MKKTLRDLLLAMLLACGAHALALAAAGAKPSKDGSPTTVAFDSCSWNRPGLNPFMGDVVAAIDRYQDIPADVRARLKARMVRREYDDLVSIRRDSIHGRGAHEYGSNIREMHFGTHQLCRTVTRAAWSPAMEERGLVYCESGHCILVPTVCRNVSRITRQDVGNDLAEAPPVEEAIPPLALAGPPPIDWFGPTGAGGPEAAGLSFEGGYGGMPAYAGTGVGFSGGPAWWPTVSTSSAAPAGSDWPGVPPRGSHQPGVPPGGSHQPGVPPVGSHQPGLPPLTAVPEPQTWALMLGGLAALLGAARRGKAPRPQAASNGFR